MCTSFINTSDKSSNTEWSLRWMASFSLRFFSDLIHHSLYWMHARMGVPIVEGLVSHEFAQESSIGSQSGEHHTHMVIDIEYFFLVGSQIIWSHF